MSRSTGALIVGGGMMGRWHGKALRHLGNPVTAVVDSDFKRRAEFQADFKRCAAFSTLDDALTGGTYSAAHVCTPVESHVAVAGRLLRAGLHVIVEKPLAPSATETESMLQTASESARLLCPVHQFLFQEGFMKARSALEQLGSVLHVDTVACSAGASHGAPSLQDEVVVDILPHPLSIFRRLLGTRFAETDWRPPVRSSGEFRALGRCEGTTLGILISMGGRPTRNTLRIIAERGTLHLDLFHGFMVREPPAVSRRRKMQRPFSLAASSFLQAGVNLVRRGISREPAYPGLRQLISEFYLAAQRGGPSPIPHSESMDVAVARDRLLE